MENLVDLRRIQEAGLEEKLFLFVKEEYGGRADKVIVLLSDDDGYYVIYYTRPSVLSLTSVRLWRSKIEKFKDMRQALNYISKDYKELYAEYVLTPEEKNKELEKFLNANKDI